MKSGLVSSHPRKDDQRITTGLVPVASMHSVRRLSQQRRLQAALWRHPEEYSIDLV